MEHKNLQKAIGLYVISEMHKENILSVNEFRKLRLLIESNNELINEIFEDFDPTDDQKIRNRFSHLAYIMSLEESDNSSNSSNSQEELSSPFATILLTKKKEKKKNEGEAGINMFSSPSIFKLRNNENS